MKIALIMNQNSYCGREYLDRLRQNNIVVDVIEIGTFPEVNKVENERCQSFWIPVGSKELEDYFPFHKFESLKSPELLEFLANQQYDLGLQGGTGILRRPVIESFNLGILNFHPGNLPQYRGCSAPEWQIFEEKPIFCTCHLVDEGIDTGRIIDKTILSTDTDSYEKCRATIYPRTADFLVDIVKKYVEKNAHPHEPQVQNEDEAQYREYIGAEKIEFIKNNRFPLKSL